MQEPLSLFRRKTWSVAGIVLLVGTAVFLFTAAFQVLLLVFLATLIAILLRGTAAYLQRKTGMRTALAMTITVVGTLGTLTGLFWFIGAKLQAQIADLTEKLPGMLATAEAEIRKAPLGRQIADKISELVSGSGGSAGTLKTARRFFNSSFGAAGDFYVIFLLTLFLTATPMLYVDGMVKLLPSSARKQGRELLEKIGAALYKWFVGTLFSMTVVALLTGIGLAIIGVPLAMTLALLAGLLAFIPNFGPVIAMGIGVMVGLLQGPQTALLVAGLYVLIQFLESNLITPLIQKKMLEIPPALIIAGQLVVGLFSGVVGLIVAMPLIALILVVVQELWIKPQDGRVPVTRS